MAKKKSQKKRYTKKPAKKLTKKNIKKVKAIKPTKAKVDQLLKMDRLIARGKERGFVTYDEILREFPTIENEIIFLDDLYEKLHKLGIDILEGGGLLEV